MSARLRQLVMACETLETIDNLQYLLALEAPFVDPGVAEFGLTNAVFALGDQFLEIVVPTNPSAPARRFIDRSGEGGYMAIFQTDDIAALRARCDTLKIRRVWDVDLDDISASHLHPADIGGAIVSVDEARPASSWRWGGPDWHMRSAMARISGADLTSPTPKALAERWASALGLAVELDDNVPHIWFEEGPVRFYQGDTEALSRFRLCVPDPAGIFSRARSLGLHVTGNAISFANMTLIIDRQQGATP